MFPLLGDFMPLMILMGKCPFTVFSKAVNENSEKAPILGQKRDCFRFFILSSVYIAGAFTQMVWAGSQKFGCGKARSSNGKVVIKLITDP